MKKIIHFVVLSFLALTCSSSIAFTQAPIVFIYDASGSMWGAMENRTKMEIAREVLSEAVDQLPAEQRIGLVAYGHRRKGDCSDVETMVPFDNTDKSAIRETLYSIKPIGKTPLAQSALQVIGLLEAADEAATIILVTDGIESCDGDLCSVVEAAKQAGIDFRLHVVGFGLGKADLDQLKCAAEAGEGNYYPANDTEELVAVLTEATETTVEKPAHNVTICAYKNNVLIDAYVVAYRDGTRTESGYARTYQDTGKTYLEPGIHDLNVKPLSGSDVEAITKFDVEVADEGVTHVNVNFDGGTITVRTYNNEELWDAVVSIYAQGSTKSVSGGRTYGAEKTYEVTPGIYDVEFRILRVKGLDVVKRFSNIEVEANKDVQLEHTFPSGIASIGATKDGALVDAVVTINEMTTGKSFGGGRTYTTPSNNPDKSILSPGTYKVSVRGVGKLSGNEDSFMIEIVPGQTVERIVEF